MKRRVPALILLAFLVALGGAPVATAQGESPAVGTPVTYVDPEGIIRGEVTIREVTDPFTGHEPSAPPEEGMRYVMLVVTFQAALDQTMDAQPYHVVLQDTDGFLHQQRFIPRPADATIPDLEGQTMAPDNRISGVITYVVPAAATLDRVLYQPASDRLIELADLSGRAGPTLGDPVTYTDALGASATITSQLIDPFTAHDPAYPPTEGTRFVVLQPVFENTGELPYYADPNDLAIRDASGRLYTYTSSLYQPEGSSVPTLEGQTMSPGDRVSGYVAFEVPVDAGLADILYYPESLRIVTVADLVGGGAGAPDEPAASPGPAASPETVASPPAASPASAASPSPAATAGIGR